MRIAIIKSNYTPYGGGEKYTTRLIKAFVKRGVFVDVLTAEAGKWSNFDNTVRWVTLKQFRYYNLLRLITFNSSANNYLKKERYNCILDMDRTEYQTHLRAGGGCHAAWIRRRCEESSFLRCLSFRLNPFHRKTIEMEGRAFLSDSLQRIFCNSYLVMKDILHYYPETVRKLMVIHNGVEWYEFSEAFEKGMTERDNVLRCLNLKSDKFYYLFIGSGYERKGLKKAIMALKTLPEDTELIVVGKDKNKKKYWRLTESLGLQERVHFFGPQINVIPFLQVSDAFILPTIYDPFSNASLEALAMGLYTITSRANGCAEVIKEDAGWIIENLKDIDSISEAMKTALSDHLTKEQIRKSVKGLDFDRQLNRIIDVCLEDTC